MEEILAPIFNFLVVVSIVVYFARKPFSAFLVARKETIEKEIQEAELQAAESEKLLKEWQANWGSHDAHAKEHLADAKASVERQKERAIAAAKAEALRIGKEATLVGQTESLRAKEKLGKELVDKSVDIARQYLKGNLEDKDQQKLVVDYLELVGTDHAR